MDRTRLKDLRFRNFDQLMKRYGDSPKRFCDETGYVSATTISQLKTRKKSFGSDIARELERHAGLEAYALESESGIDGKQQQERQIRQPSDWPFSVSLRDILALQGKTVREIDDALTKLVVGAQAQEMLAKQKKRVT